MPTLERYILDIINRGIWVNCERQRGAPSNRSILAYGYYVDNENNVVQPKAIFQCYRVGMTYVGIKGHHTIEGVTDWMALPLPPDEEDK